MANEMVETGISAVNAVGLAKKAYQYARCSGRGHKKLPQVSSQLHLRERSTGATDHYY